MLTSYGATHWGLNLPVWCLRCLKRRGLQDCRQCAPTGPAPGRNRRWAGSETMAGKQHRHKCRTGSSASPTASPSHCHRGRQKLATVRCPSEALRQRVQQLFALSFGWRRAVYQKLQVTHRQRDQPAGRHHTLHDVVEPHRNEHLQSRVEKARQSQVDDATARLLVRPPLLWPRCGGLLNDTAYTVSQLACDTTKRRQRGRAHEQTVTCCLL